MRKWIAVVGVALVPACGDSTGPTPDFVGAYAFVVEASSVCALPVARFNWDLVATSVGGGSGSDPGGPFLLTLPGGDPTLNLNLTYSSGGSRGGGKSSSNTLSVSIGARQVPFGDQFEVTISGGRAQGTASVAPDGRGQIVDGTLNGTITVAEARPSPLPSPRPSPPPPPVSCTAADHRFTLTPR